MGKNIVIFSDGTPGSAAASFSTSDGATSTSCSGIDEARNSFRRVPWDTPKDTRHPVAGNPARFQQISFAGNHSDIGGSYPEAESRLSDIALKWMLDAAVHVGMRCRAGIVPVARYH